MMPYLDEYDIGRVFVYLMQGSTPICFYSAPTADFLDPNPKMKWISFNPDLAIGKVTDVNKAGLLSIKLSIHNTTAKGPINFSDYPAWKKPPPKRAEIFRVRVYLF